MTLDQQRKANVHKLLAQANRWNGFRKRKRTFEA